ncbi:MAG: SAF domain-containing protein [Oscillospiraceae bacterium]|nr:MAG: SAF domain-containing protein [Oscillospiraceae bacterium]
MFKKTPKAPKEPKPPKIKVQKTRKIGNRTLIGILSIVVALLICFGVAPVINRVADSKTEIVRVKTLIPKGTCINESDLETVTVGAYNLPENVIRKKADAVGKYATGDLYAGDWILPRQPDRRPGFRNGHSGFPRQRPQGDVCHHRLLCAGLSGKLETGTLFRLLSIPARTPLAFTPPELQYLRVITSTTSQGVDKSDVTDATQPVTVTLLVNQAQAEQLAYYEKTASMHFALEYRGDRATAQKYLDAQAQYFYRPSKREGLTNADERKDHCGLGFSARRENGVRRKICGRTCIRGRAGGCCIAL